MITAIHTLVYSDDPTATRAFFTDGLQWPFVSEGSSGDGGIGGAGTGGGDPAEWLIFRTGPSELGVHPSSGEHGGREWSAPRHHAIAVTCDDLDTTKTELADGVRSSPGNRGRWDPAVGRSCTSPEPTTCCSTSRTTPRPMTCD